MDFELSGDQRSLREAARDLLDGLSSPERVRKAEGYDAELWRAMTEQGWSLLALPEEQGGLGMSFVEVAVLAEEVGRHVAAAPYLPTVLAIDALQRSGAAPDLLGRLVDGAVGAVAWRGDVVPFGPVADVLVVIGDDSVTGHDVSELRYDAVAIMDLTRIAGGPLSPEGGTPLGGSDLAAELLDRGASAYAAELLGASQRMLEVSVDYAKVREQFGRPIGSFQAVKHRCADMLVDVEGMRSAVYYAAWALATGADDAAVAASVAKSTATDAGTRVMGSALQVHGGIGFTWEHDLHLYLKRNQLSGRLFGDATYHRERIVRLLQARVADGTGLF